MTRSKTGSRRTLTATILALTGLALAVTLWSAFLWWQLIEARASGSDPFCAFGDPGACGELWDGAFASGVHRWSGVPVAGWGLIWGIAALALTAAVGSGKASRASLRWIAWAGLLAVAGLATASLLQGVFCSSCLLAYLPAAAFGALALRRPGGGEDRRGGLGLAAGALAGAYLLALYPGLETPGSTAGESRRALRAAAEAGSKTAGSAGPEAAAAVAAGLPPRFTAGPGTGDEGRDRQLATLIENLPPQLRQAMSDLLVAYDGAPALEEAAPRALEGPSRAPVRIVEFTDTLCTHCATLFESLRQLHEISPEGSFSVDQRHYPLDGNCNRYLPVHGPESIRCVAARAKICAEGRPGSQAFVGELYRVQADLTEDRFWRIAETYFPRAELEACTGSAATAGTLAGDVELAGRYRPRGTPLVIVNGREANAFTPFLYALILNGGSVSHPAFAALPAPSS